MRAAARYVRAIEAALAPLRDPARAAAMAAYMRDRFPFLGIPTPARRSAVKAVPAPPPAEVHAAVLALWRKKEREHQYVAVDLLARSARRIEGTATLRLIEELAQAKSWWDTVDGLAGIAAGLLRNDPGSRHMVRAWSEHPSFWVNRLAILHQKGWRAATDEKVLFALCLRHAASREFFVEKAIGWALREYAWTEPAAVKRFVEANRDALSPLSVREALKNAGAVTPRTPGR